MKKAIVVFSGGIDSISMCAYLKEKYELYGISFLYGQKANQEIKKAKAFAKILRLKEHKIVNISFMKELYGNTNVLTDSKITIMSTDKDFLQLANERIKVWSPTKKKMYDEDAVLNEYGISSHNLIWYRVLDGDKSDNIPGVRGLGLKTIQKNQQIKKQQKEHRN